MFQPYSFAIVDFSKNNPFPPATDLLTAVRSAAGIDSGRLIVIARQNQRAELQAAAATVRLAKWIDDISEFQLALPVPVVKQELASLLALAPKEAILVTSYNGVVLGEVQRLGNPNVDVQSLSKFKYGYAPSGTRATGPTQFLIDASSYTHLSPPPAKPYWRFDGFITRQDAQGVLLRALQRRGAVDRQHTVSMPNLKPAMADLDGRFVGSGYANGTGGMIGMLAAGAHFDGLLEAAESYNKTPYYWLSARGLQELAAYGNTELSSPSAGQTEIFVAPTTSTSITAPVTSVDVHVESRGPVTTVVRPARERSPHKSQRMQDALIDSGWGPRTKPRIVMLDRVGDILGQRNNDTLSDILDVARNDMIQDVVDGPERQAAVAAIGAVRKMLREFLPASKALKDRSNNPLPTGFRAGPAVIGDFDADWRMRAEAQLLLKLVEMFPEPIDAEHDIENIIGALYHVRNGPDRRDLKRQVEAMIGYLLDENLVHEDFQNGHQILVFGAPKAANSSAEASQLRIANDG